MKSQKAIPRGKTVARIWKGQTLCKGLHRGRQLGIKGG